MKFQHEEMAKAFARSEEIKKLKAEIIQEVLNSISINVYNTAENEIDKLLNKLK